MSELPHALFGRWRHAFEEDGAEGRVYRPASSPLPRARGRAEVEFRADGTVTEWRVGRGDAREAVHGRWTLGADRRLTLDFGEGGGGTRRLEVARATGDQLVLRDAG